MGLSDNVKIIPWLHFSAPGIKNKLMTEIVTAQLSKLERIQLLVSEPWCFDTNTACEIAEMCEDTTFMRSKKNETKH